MYNFGFHLLWASHQVKPQLPVALPFWGSCPYKLRGGRCTNTGIRCRGKNHGLGVQRPWVLIPSQPVPALPWTSPLHTFSPVGMCVSICYYLYLQIGRLSALFEWVNPKRVLVNLGQVVSLVVLSLFPGLSLPLFSLPVWALSSVFILVNLLLDAWSSGPLAAPVSLIITYVDIVPC